MRQRIEWLDVIKGFLILTVMLGHISRTPEWIEVWIYSFHMPLFFFLSGITFSTEKYDFKSFLFRKIRTLIIPGLVFEIFIIVINIGFGKLHIDIKNFALGVILQMRGQGTDIAWFLVALFMSEIFLYLIIKILKNQHKKISLFLLFMGILNFIYLKLAGKFLNYIVLPYSMDLIFIILPYIYAGYLYKIDKLKINESVIFTVIYAVMGTLLCFISYKILGYHFDIDLDKIGSFLLYYLTAFAQINWLIIVFKKIKKLKLLPFIGRNSIIFYVWHMQAFYIYTLVMANVVVERYLVLILEMITSIIMLSILSIVINKYFPYILGRKKEIK